MGPEHTRPREAARKCKAKQRAEQGYTKLGQGRPGQAAFGEIFQRMSHPPKKNSNLSTPPRQQVVAKKTVRAASSPSNSCYKTAGLDYHYQNFHGFMSAGQGMV